MSFQIPPGYIFLWIAAALMSITFAINGVPANALIPFAIAAALTGLVEAMKNID